MSLDVIDETIEYYKALFSLDSLDELQSIQKKIEDLLEEHSGLNDALDNDELIELVRKTILRVFSENPLVVKKVEASFAHFEQQQESGLREYTYVDSDSPLSDQEVEIMYESQGIWGSLPHILVKANWDLIRKAAVKFHDPSRIDPELEFDDLLSVGGEALIHAAEKQFEKARPDFPKFALQTIKDKIKSHQNSRHPVPYKTRKKLEKLREAREETGLSSHDEGTTKALSEKVGLSRQEMKGLYEVESIWGHGHFVDVGDRMEELEIPDLSPDALSLLIDQETSMRMSQAMTELSDVQRNIILQIYFRDRSFRQTAETLNLSLSVVKKHHRNAMTLLKGGIDESE